MIEREKRLDDSYLIVVKIRDMILSTPGYEEAEQKRIECEIAELNRIE